MLSSRKKTLSGEDIQHAWHELFKYCFFFLCTHFLFSNIYTFVFAFYTQYTHILAYSITLCLSEQAVLLIGLDCKKLTIWLTVNSVM